MQRDLHGWVREEAIASNFGCRLLLLKISKCLLNYLRFKILIFGIGQKTVLKCIN